MRVTKDMVHADLQPYYRRLMLLTGVAKTVVGARVLDRVQRLGAPSPAEGLDSSEERIASTSGGPPIRVRLYRPAGHTGPLPGFLYLHGGAYRAGTPEGYAWLVKRFMDTRPCVVVAPDYRLSPQAPFPAGFDDSYDTLLWLRDHAEQLRVRPDALFVGGHSAGGGLTAAVTLKARDTGDVHVAFQMPFYPMIDDRLQTVSARFESPVFSATQNAQAWDLYLRGLHAAAEPVPAYAAPARATDHAGLPPTITFVGGIDPFRDETVAYVQALRAAGVPVTFRLFEGCFHGFDAFTATGVARAAARFQLDAYADLYDTCLASGRQLLPAPPPRSP